LLGSSHKVRKPLKYFYALIVFREDEQCRNTASHREAAWIHKEDKKSKKEILQLIRCPELIHSIAQQSSR